MKAVLAIAAVSVALLTAPPAHAAKWKATDDGCIDQAETATIKAHRDVRKGWTPAKVQAAVGAAGRVDHLDPGPDRLLSFTTCEPDDYQRVTAYFEKYRGKLRLVEVSSKADF